MIPLSQVQRSTVMDTRQQLIEDWKAKFAVSSQLSTDHGTRFAWVRQLYTRIYRFLISSYSAGDWRGAGDDSSVSVDSSSTTSRMPFVDYRPSVGGLVPKSAERIRNTLDAIHRSNPGIATAGTMSGVSGDTWIVVATRKESASARAVHQMLTSRGIESRIQNRTTDIAIIVYHQDFTAALDAIQQAVPMKQISIRRRTDPASAVGLVLLIASVFTCVTCLLLGETVFNRTVSVIAISAGGLAAGWLFYRGVSRR
jgi:hypothetical protein